MQGTDLIGWAASVVLIATLVRQTITQWRADDPQGVSSWLFAGQITASILFVAYSVLLKNMVFIVTNSLILATAIVGQCVYLRARHASRDKPGPRT